MTNALFSDENIDSACITNDSSSSSSSSFSSSSSSVVINSPSSKICNTTNHNIEKQSYSSCSNLPPWVIEKEREFWGKRLRVLEWEDDCNIGDKHLDDYRALNGWKVRSRIFPISYFLFPRAHSTQDR